MKNTTRFLLGLLSSVLLSVGLVRAASHLDPMTHSLSATGDSAGVPAPDTGSDCWVDEPNR